MTKPDPGTEGRRVFKDEPELAHRMGSEISIWVYFFFLWVFFFTFDCWPVTAIEGK